MKNHLVPLNSILTLCGRQYGKGAPWGPLTHTRNVEEATCKSCLNSAAIDVDVAMGRLLDNRKEIKHELMYVQITSTQQGFYKCSCGLFGEVNLSKTAFNMRSLVLERLEAMHVNHVELVAIRKQV